MTRIPLAYLLLPALLALDAGAWAQALDFSGTWLRDERTSDDAAEKAQTATSNPGGSGSRWGGSWPGGSAGRGGAGGAGGRGGRSPGGGRPGGPGGDREESSYERLGKGLQVLQIEQQGTQLTIKNANRETRVVFSDGRAIADGLGNQTSARLQGDRLVIDTRTERTQMVETFVLDPGRERLTLTTDIQSNGGGRTPSFQFRTVYELLAPAVSSGGDGVDGVDRGDTVSAKAPAAELEPSAPPTGDTETPTFAAGTALRILPPKSTGSQLLRGKALVQTLIIDPTIVTVEFFLDDERVARRNLPPYETKIELADPPREQVVRAVGYGPGDRQLGEDRLVLNRLDPPLRVRIAAIDPEPGGATLRVRAEVSVPRKAKLERVTFYRGETEVAALTEPPFEAQVPGRDIGPQDYVRVAARVADGREVEDVELIQSADFSEKIQVHLVQLQVLVTDRAGYPITGLSASDFEVKDGGQMRKVERLYPSRDVALVLGLAIDSSGSMWAMWQQTKDAAEAFLDRTLETRDRAFVVDFDTQLRLLQPLTGNHDDLVAAMGRLQPEGGTALYDSILFSLLQYQGEPGRRALIVLTDGYDSASRADPARAIEFGQRLGVPVYVIAMTGGASATGAAAMRSRGGIGSAPGGASAGILAQGSVRNQLRLITDPTGGRLYHAGSADQVAHAFAQIEDELRNQYILTYYTDRPPETASDAVVKALGKGNQVKTALPLDLAN